MFFTLLKFAAPILIDFLKELILPKNAEHAKSPLGLRVAVLFILILIVLLSFSTVKLYELHERTVNAETIVKILKADDDSCDIKVEHLQAIKSRSCPPTICKGNMVPRPHIIKVKPTNRVDHLKIVHEINNG